MSRHRSSKRCWPAAATLGAPVERDVVVLVADIRGYTALTEGLPPRVLVEQVLNRYFTAMTEALYRHGEHNRQVFGRWPAIGVFGSPIARDDDIERSLLAAVNLQLAFAELSRRWRADLAAIGMGIGTWRWPRRDRQHRVRPRMDYTLIGDVVNTASRLNGIAAGRPNHRGGAAGRGAAGRLERALADAQEQSRAAQGQARASANLAIDGAEAIAKR